MESLKIKVDVKKRTTENINLQQGYTYPIELAIYDNGKEYDCSGATPQIHFAKSNGKFTIKTKDITISGNKVSFILDSEATNKSGTGKLQAVLNKDGFTFGSWAIFCNIFENVIQDGATEDENIIDVLGELKEDINKAEPLAKSLETNIPKAESLSSSLTTQIPEATALVDEMKAAIEEGGTVDRRELGDFLEGFDGTTHLNLNERINYDVDYLQQQINNSSLLPYEGTSVKADNSYYGLTKDMVIKGRTLQNLLDKDTFYNTSKWNGTNGQFSLVSNKGYVTLTANGGFVNGFILLNNMFKPSTKYTIVMDIKENSLSKEMVSGFVLCGSSSMEITTENKNSSNCDFTPGTKKILITTKEDLSSCSYSLRSFIYSGIMTGKIVYRVIILEGDHTNTPIEDLPFGEGIYSVGENEITEDGRYKISGKSCGKNLFDINAKAYTSRPYTVSMVINEGLITISSTSPADWDSFNIKVDRLKYSTYYIISFENVDYPLSDSHIGFYERSTNTLLGGAGTPFKIPETINLDDVYIRVHLNKVGTTYTTCTVKNIQLEEGTVATDYEPYQESAYSYILNEPLRSLPNGVADTIEGNKVIRRIGKVVLDGVNIKLNDYGKNESIIRGAFINSDMKHCTKIMCDSMPANVSGIDTLPWSIIGVSCYYENVVYFHMDITLYPTIDDVNNFIKENPLTIYYELAEPIIENIEPTLQLKTFDGKTHIISDNYLLPITSAKIPSDVNLVVQNLRTENEALSSELNEAVEVLNNTDTDIIAMSWETDFRVCELEWIVYDNLQIETYNTKDTKEIQGRILTRYDQAKIIIESGKYNKTTMERQLKAYYDRGYLSEEEFEELISLM